MSKLTEKVINSLQEKILNGKLQSGARITENELSLELGISRTPIREAIRRMESEGLLENIPNVGTFVRKVSIEEIIEIFDVRSVLEGLAARLFAGRVKSKETISKLQECSRQYSDFTSGKRKDLEKRESIDIEFHTLIINNCGNRELQKQLLNKSFLIHAFTKRSMFIPPEELLRKIPQEKYGHDKILSVIMENDAEVAEKIMRNHILEGKAQLLMNIAKNGNDFV